MGIIIPEINVFSVWRFRSPFMPLMGFWGFLRRRLWQHVVTCPSSDQVILPPDKCSHSAQHLGTAEFTPRNGEQTSIFIHGPHYTAVGTNESSGSFWSGAQGGKVTRLPRKTRVWGSWTVAYSEHFSADLKYFIRKKQNLLLIKCAHWGGLR